MSYRTRRFITLYTKSSTGAYPEPIVSSSQLPKIIFIRYNLILFCETSGFSAMKIRVVVFTMKMKATRISETLVSYQSTKSMKLYRPQDHDLTLSPTQPPIQCVPVALSLGLKRPGREAGHSPPSSAEVENAWSYISTPPVRLHDVVPG
jgi:hypothetical protein